MSLWAKLNKVKCEYDSCPVLSSIYYPGGIQMTTISASQEPNMLFNAQIKKSYVIILYKVQCLELK